MDAAIDWKACKRNGHIRWLSLQCTSEGLRLTDTEEDRRGGSNADADGGGGVKCQRRHRAAESGPQKACIHAVILLEDLKSIAL